MVSVPLIGVVMNWRNENNKSGLYPVHIRITKGKLTRYYRVPIPQKVAPNQWSGKESSWVKPSHPFAFEINCKISEIKALITDYIKRTYNFGKRVTVEGIMASLSTKGDNKNFFDFMNRYIQRPPERLELSTLKKYKTTLTHLRTFTKQLVFADLDNNLIRDFTRYLQTDLNVGGAATKKYLEVIKKIVRQAIRENFMPGNSMEILFDDLKVKVEKAKRTFLDLAEVKSWKAVRFTEEEEHLERDRDLFLFQVYTGYYYADLPIFTKDQLQQDSEYGQIIIGARNKNGNQTIIPLFKFPYAETIIQRYRSPANEKNVFNKNCFIEEPAYNRNLKKIAAMAGIHKSVSNKVARHTNAQLWIRYGAEGAVLSKMMGHTKQETTRNYYEVNLPEIVEGTKRVDFETMGI